MTKWHDPVLQAAEGLVVIKLIHVFVGSYIWEFVLNLDYEYSLITGKHKFNWSVPFYLGCRWSTLLVMILHLVNLDTPYAINCEAWLIVISILVFFGFQSAACLIILRIYALWERKRVFVGITFAVWLAATTVFAYDATIVVTHARRDGNICEIGHMVDVRISVITVFVADIVLLSLMLFGVLHWEFARMPGCHGELWQIMRRRVLVGMCRAEGFIYVLVATLADIPPMTLLLLNLNEPMDEVLMIPSMVIMMIGALRMYRGLIDGAALKGPVEGLVGCTMPSAIRFTRSVSREDTLKTGGTVPELCPTASPQRCVYKEQDEEFLGNKTA